MEIVEIIICGLALFGLIAIVQSIGLELTFRKARKNPGVPVKVMFGEGTITIGTNEEGGETIYPKSTDKTVE